MNISLQHVGVHLDFQRREGRAAFFCEHLASGGGDARVDLSEQFVIEQGNVVPQGLMAEDFGLLAPRRGRHAQHLAHERIVVGDMFQAIPVRVQTRRTTPSTRICHIHAGAAGGRFAASTAAFSRPRISARSVGCIQSHCSPARIGGNSSRLLRGRRIFSMGVIWRSGSLDSSDAW